jgi:hypothetical protein
MYSFLMIGQSNMAGRGFAKEVEPIQNPDLYVLRNGRWIPMYVPVNPDRRTAGISLAESFADAYARKHGAKVGLIPCADGGTSVTQWQPGEVLFENAVFQAQLAMRSSELLGIIWHQGEADCSDERREKYFERCMRVMCEIRQRLGVSDIPIVIGGLGDFLIHRPEVDLHNYDLLNREFERVAGALDRAAFVSANGLLSNPDMLHFNAASLREFGLRYFDAFERIAPKNDSEADTQDAPRLSDIERL